MSDTYRCEALPRLARQYWSESAQPLTSLVFIAPLLVIYEAGVRLLGTQAARNGADVWMRRVLEWLDFDHYFLLPLLTVAILLAWHHMTRQSWRISRAVLWVMAIECILLAICLRGLLYVQGAIWHLFSQSLAPADPSATAMDLSGTASRVIGFLGAGIYEELLFRLILLSLVVWIIPRLGWKGRSGLIGAVVLTSLVFAAAHYVGRNGDPLALGQMSFWFGFLFRWVAGMFFSLLFLYRGFGIAAGTHAGYDILVGTW